MVVEHLLKRQEYAIKFFFFCTTNNANLNPPTTIHHYFILHDICPGLVVHMSWGRVELVGHLALLVNNDKKLRFISCINLSFTEKKNNMDNRIYFYSGSNLQKLTMKKKKKLI